MRAFNTCEHAPTTCHLCSWHLRYPSKRRGIIFTLTSEALLTQACTPVNHTVTGRVWEEGKESRARWGRPRGYLGGLRVRWHLARMQSDHAQSHETRGNRHQEIARCCGQNFTRLSEMGATELRGNLYFQPKDCLIAMSRTDCYRAWGRAQRPARR